MTHDLPPPERLRETGKAAAEPNWNILLPDVDGSSDPRHVQLMRAIVACIENHGIAAGVRLPSSRQLSASLGLGRNTVILAIDGLIEQGYLVSKDRSGVRVASAGRPVGAAASPQSAGPSHDWARRFAFDAAGPPVLPDGVGSAGAHSFLYGQFDETLFPTGPWRECERAALGVREIARWGRDMVDEDASELVDQLRANVLPYHGIWAKPDEVLVTLGGQEGRYLVAQLLCRTGVRAGLENPGMPDMNKIVGLTGASRTYLDVDGDGLVLSDEINHCDVVFSTVGHQCPTGTGMSSARKKELLARAEQHDFVIVEDTFETESLRHSDETPSLKSMDSRGRVIYIGSLSKLLAPGLRVGVIVAPAVVIRQLRALRRLIHRHPPGNTQLALAMFIERGFYRSYVRRVAKELDLRCATLEEEFAKWLPDFRWQHLAGTSSFWVEMSEGLDSDQLVKAAAERGVLLESGSRFFHTEPRSTRHLRVALSSVAPEGIRQGVRILADVVERLRLR